MRTIRIAATAAILTVGLAACSNSSSTTSAGRSAPSTPAGGSSGGATVATADVGDLGTVLVDGDGNTLYLFKSDTSSSSTCSGACADMWPALTTDGDPTAGDGTTADLLGTTERDDGTTQVTYDGHPLYLYSGDMAAGDANGEGVGNVWYVVGTDGAAVLPDSNSGGSRGY